MGNQKLLIKLFSGPGGFAEYLLYINNLYTKGYGISLVEQCDYNLEAFNIQSHAECFSPIYGPSGSGDITDFVNQEYFIKNILNDTYTHGVHVVCADGGFSVNGNEAFQEQLSLDLFLSQCFVGLSILQTGGVYICKVFDTYTNFSVGLIYLLYACFQEITIYKPVTCRPGNSERYVICNSLHSADRTRPIFSYIYHLIKNRSDTPLYKIQILPWPFLLGDVYFMDYFKNRLYDIEQTQIKAVGDILQQIQKISPSKSNPISIEHLLSFWNIHYNNKNNMHLQQNFKHPNQIYNNLVYPYDGDVILSRFIPTLKNSKWYDIHATKTSTWHLMKICAASTEITCTLYSCFIKSIIHTYIDGKWTYNNLKINLPVNTIVLAILYKNTFFILDAIMIGGQNLLDIQFTQRQKKIHSLIKVITCISDGKLFENYVNISPVKFIKEALPTPKNIIDDSNKNLYLAVNEKSFVDKCLFYK